MIFSEKLNRSIDRSGSLLCVGLDPDPRRLPPSLGDGADAVIAFNRRIIAATQDLAAAYKPNFAFYGALGAAGWEVLTQTLRCIPRSIPVILDAKVGDIGNTAEQYSRMFFAELGADALTVNGYMGADAVAPFLGHSDRGVFLLCLTSNSGAADFQTQLVDGRPLYELVARRAHEWNTQGNMGLVVGATQTEAIARIRALAPNLPFLIPGVGAQGGDLRAAVTRAKDQQGRGLLINASRAVLYASPDTDFADAARAATTQLRDAINAHR